MPLSFDHAPSRRSGTSDNFISFTATARKVYIPYGLYWRFLEWICLHCSEEYPRYPFLAVEIKSLIRIPVVPGESRHRRTVGQSSRDNCLGGCRLRSIGSGYNVTGPAG